MSPALHTPCSHSDGSGPSVIRSLRRSTSRVLAAIVVVVAMGDLHEDAAAAPAREVSTSLSQKLRTRVTATWENQTLDRALHQLASLHGIPIWRDRRLDPHALFKLQVKSQSLRYLLDELARDAGASLRTTRYAVYLGPPGAAENLAEGTAEFQRQLKRLPIELQREWMRREGWECPQLSEPRNAIERLATSCGWTIVNPDAVPYDLWGARSLPPMPRSETLMFLLVNFDLKCEVESERRLRLVPTPLHAPDDAPRSARIPRPSGVDTPDELDRQRLSLQVRQKPLGAVLDSLATQLALQIEFADSNHRVEIRERRVSLEANQADVDRVLRMLLGPLDAAHVRDGRRVTIERAPR
ncbi:MAG: hypothetical protein KDA61_05245 [Planctomycetales bacterium]|nr:hypothetical protein [Planctomycetales bacterium]